MARESQRSSLLRGRRAANTIGEIGVHPRLLCRLLIPHVGDAWPLLLRGRRALRGARAGESPAPLVEPAGRVLTPRARTQLDGLGVVRGELRVERGGVPRTPGRAAGGRRLAEVQLAAQRLAHDP